MYSVSIGLRYCQCSKRYNKHVDGRSHSSLCGDSHQSWYYWKTNTGQQTSANLGASTSNVDEVTKITVMLLSITVTYIILIVPMTVVVLMVDGGGRKLSDYALLIAFSNLPYLNMSLNFYLYLLSGQMFRNEVKHFLTRYCKCYSNEKESPEEPAGNSSTSTAETESNYI